MRGAKCSNRRLKAARPPAEATRPIRSAQTTFVFGPLFAPVDSRASILRGKPAFARNGASKARIAAIIAPRQATCGSGNERGQALDHRGMIISTGSGAVRAEARLT